MGIPEEYREKHRESTHQNTAKDFWNLQQVNIQIQEAQKVPTWFDWDALYEYILDRLSEVQGQAGEVAGSEKWLPHKHDNLNLTPAPHEKPDMVTLTYNPSKRWRQAATENSSLV